MEISKIRFSTETLPREKGNVTFPSGRFRAFRLEICVKVVNREFPPGENPSHFWATCPKIGLRRAPELSGKKISTRIPLGEAWRGLEGPDVIFLFSNGPPKSSLRSPLRALLISQEGPKIGWARFAIASAGGQTPNDQDSPRQILRGWRSHAPATRPGSLG